MGSCKCGCGCQTGCYNKCPCPDASSNIYPAAGSVVVQNSWNVPACDANATLNVPGLKSAVVGYYYGNPTYGFYKIISFDAVLGQVIVQNTCLEGNAAPGTVVPAFTPFSTESNLVEQVLSPWVDFSGLFVTLTSSAAAPTGVVVTEAVYKESLYDLVDFYAEVTFTVVGTPTYIYAPTPPLPAFSLVYDLTASLVIQDGDSSLKDNPVVQIFPNASTFRFRTSNSTTWTAGAGGIIRISGRYRKA